MKRTDFSVETCAKLGKAIKQILTGTIKRADINPFVKVYACGSNVVRIDLKVIGDDE